MAETIRGINVVIGAETTGLSKALSDVNKKSRDIQSELRQVEKLLKLDPTNTELLAQKQKLLSDAVANTSEKLNRLKAAQEQVNQQFERGEISEGQYRAFQREIVKTEQELRNFEDRLEQTGKAANELGEKLSSVGEKMKGTGEKMSVAITAPIIAAGGLMVKGAAEAETAQGKLQASLGLTAEEAKKLGEIAREVWKDGFGENIDEANQALIAVRQNMAGLAEEELARVTEGAMTIAQVFDQDVKEVTAAAGVMMKNFGISGQEALDIITVGFQKGGDFSGELLDTLREYAPQFKSLGLSADQAMAMLISGAQAGAWNLDKVGDAMKEFNIRAQDGSKTTAEGFAIIGLNAEEMAASIAAGGEEAEKAFLATVTALANMEDPLKQNLAGVALFGTQWEDVRANVITALEDGKNGLINFKGATEEAIRALQENDPGLAIRQAMRELQDAIGPALLSIADIIKNTVVPAVKSLAEWFSELSPTGQKVFLVIAGIAAVIGPLLVVIGAITSALPILGAAFTALTGPVGLVVAAVAGLVTAGVVLYKNWDDIKKKLADIWKAISDIASKVWDGLKNFFDQWGKTILLLAVGPAGWAVLLAQKLGFNWDTIKRTAENIWNTLKNTLSNVWNSIKTTASSVWDGIKTAILSPIENAKRRVLDIIDSIKSAFANMRITIPKPKLPHITISTKYKTIGDIRIPYPDFDIDWYAQGGIFTRPTIIGVGEAGPEAVVPLDKAGAIGGVTVNMYGPVNVRDDSDIQKIARELFNLQQRAARAKGLA